MNKKIIVIATLAILGAFFLSQSVHAINALLSIFPATASKNVDVTFNIAVQVNPQGNNVCVVKGILSFHNLTCRSITVASGLMAQTTPTCASPSFVLGIPKCTTVAKNILTLAVKGNAVGQAKASLTGFNVIGVGVLVPSGSSGGAYTITSISKFVPTPASGTTTPIEIGNPTTSTYATSTTGETANSTSSLFDITATPVLPAQQDVIPIVVFSAIGGIVLLFLVIVIVRWVWKRMDAKRGKKNEVNKNNKI